MYVSKLPNDSLLTIGLEFPQGLTRPVAMGILLHSSEIAFDLKKLKGQKEKTPDFQGFLKISLLLYWSTTL